MRIAILDDYQDAVRHLPCFSLLQDHEVKIFNNSALGMMQLAIRLAPFDAVILHGQRTAVSGVLLGKLPNLKLIVQTGAADEHIDRAAVQARGIAVHQTADDPLSKAELTWALILAASRKLPQYANHLRQGLWQMASIDPARNTLGRRLHGKTLGIWDDGNAGQHVAQYGRAFGMQVLIWGSEASRDFALQQGFAVAQTREQLFSEADVLSLHLHFNESTRYIVTAQDLACMKPDALFVNSSRAALVASDVLAAALRQGRPGFAALDVFDKEPPGKDHPLLLPNVLATPHIGDVTQEEYETQYREAFEQVVRFAGSVS